MTAKDSDDLATRVADKQKEVTHYEGVLDRYMKSPSRTNRWYQSGKDHLHQLRLELAELEAQLTKQNEKDQDE